MKSIISGFIKIDAEPLLVIFFDLHETISSTKNVLPISFEPLCSIRKIGVKEYLHLTSYDVKRNNHVSIIFIPYNYSSKSLCLFIHKVYLLISIGPCVRLMAARNSYSFHPS